MPRSACDEIDRMIAANIRQRRIERGLSQRKLARPLGVSFQQLQKYENATSRVSATMLFKIGQVLFLPIEAFFATRPDRGIGDDSGKN